MGGLALPAHWGSRPLFSKVLGYGLPKPHQRVNPTSTASSRDLGKSFEFLCQFAGSLVRSWETTASPREAH